MSVRKNCAVVAAVAAVVVLRFSDDAIYNCVPVKSIKVDGRVGYGCSVFKISLKWKRKPTAKSELQIKRTMRHFICVCVCTCVYVCMCACVCVWRIKNKLN